MQTRLMAMLVAALLLLGGAPAALAADNTYRGSAQVTSQSGDELADGLRRALSATVVRLTGGRDLLARGDVAGALAQAPQFVLQYHYEPSAAGYTLVAFFDRNAVDNMLAELGAGSLAGTETVSGPPSEALVQVIGIDSAIDYARMLGQLEKLELVRNVQPEQVNEDRVTLRLQLGADLRSFLAVLESSGNMLMPTDAAGSGVDAVLAYQR